MKAKECSETLVSYVTTQHQKPKYRDLNLHRCEKLRSRVSFTKIDRRTYETKNNNRILVGRPYGKVRPDGMKMIMK